MRTCIIAPCFNESDGIGTYISELDSCLSGIELILFDDCSLDGTVEMIQTTLVEQIVVTVIQNSQNLGHGRTIRKAWEYALRGEYSIIVLVDGDGQIPGFGIRKGLEIFESEGLDIFEGVRTGRTDPWFRKLISRMLRVLVFLNCGKMPSDANTPFRIYSKETLSKMINQVPTDSPTPNLHVSILTRKLRLRYLEVPVITRDRLGDSKIGSTWSAKTSLLPSKKLLLFCFSALKSIALRNR
jgi:dolichol-phosphate mannosyltransferase